jgi:arsenate reductase (thioredoxin)
VGDLPAEVDRVLDAGVHALAASRAVDGRTGLDALGLGVGEDEGLRAAIEAMRERGIDISGEYPKPWTDEVVRAADVVVSMGCGDACPIFPGKRYEDWVLDDPAGKSVEAIRPVRDEIERRVRHLLDELNVPVAAS